MHIIKCALQASDIWTKTRPQNRELHALLFTISVWVLLRSLLAITVKMQSVVWFWTVKSSDSELVSGSSLVSELVAFDFAVSCFFYGGYAA